MPVVELFGQAQLLAGVKAADVGGGTLLDALRELAGHYPALIGTVLEAGGEPTPAYTVNLNGTQFVRDLAQPLRAHDHILLISRLSGG